VPYDLCLFDLDGTLSDPKVGITKSYQYALKSFGIDESLDDLTRFIGPPLRSNFREYYGFSEENTEKAVIKYREYFGKAGLYENEIYPGIPEALKILTASGKTLAVATNKLRSYSITILEHFALDNFFGFVSGDDLDGNLTKNGKREIIRIALDALDPDRKMLPVMIGDREHDIFGARDKGIDSIGITWGYGSRSELESAGATWIVESTEELCRLILG